MSADNTRAPRYEVCGARVVYDTGEEFWSGPVVDMSESGLFIETHHELPPKTVVTIIPDIPDGGALPFELRAVVVRTNEYDPTDHWDRTPGLAFRFEGLTPENLSLLRAFLESRGVPKTTPGK